VQPEFGWEPPAGSRLELARIGEKMGCSNRRSGNMKYRIGMWASVGFLVASCWALYGFTRAIPLTSADPIVYTLASFMQPILLVGFHFHFGLYFYWVLIANAATYALIGVAVETLRQQLSQAK
jgi:hypothetical protein